MSISNYLEAKLLDATFNSQPFAVTGDPYVSLHTGDPGETGLSVGELTSGTSPRKQVNFNNASGGTLDNATHAYFTSVPGQFTITHIGVWDSLTGGNHLWSGALTTAKVVNQGDTFELGTNDIDVTLD